jgi:ABC-type nitrate/sulfonate/bicarbonate transport system substrate-binding protein
VDHASDLADGASNFAPFGTAIELASAAVSVVNGSGVWGVRVLRASTRFAFQPLVYGEEWRDASTALRRAHEIAEGFAAGQKP